MLVGEPFPGSHARRSALNRATLRHLALLLLLTPLLGGMRLLVLHLDQRPGPAPVVIRELVEVPRTEYVQVEVPVPTIVVVDLPAPTESVEPLAAAEPEPVDGGELAEAAVTDDLTLVAQQADDLSSSYLARPIYRPLPAQLIAEPEASPAEEAAEPLAAAPTETPLIAEPVVATVEPGPAERTLAEFYAYTDQHWSAQGYSSPADMRESLGNSTTGWLTKMRGQAAQEAAAALAVEQAAAEAAQQPVVAAARPAEPVVQVAESKVAEPVAEPVAEVAEPVAEVAEPVAEVAEPVAEAVEPVAEVAEPVAVPPEPVAVAPEPEVIAATPTDSDRALADFTTYTERHWSAQGYSSAEEMRRALGSSWLERSRQAGARSSQVN